jgi:hypothetical protein
MNEHHEYTIAGTTYYAVGNRLYVEIGKVHELTDVDDHPFHLIDGIPCRLHWGGSVYSAVKANPIGWDLETAWKHLPADGFEGAVALEAVRPDGIHECPECGGWAGPDKEPTCLGCGYGGERQ